MCARVRERACVRVEGPLCSLRSALSWRARLGRAGPIALYVGEASSAAWYAMHTNQGLILMLRTR